MKDNDMIVDGGFAVFVAVVALPPGYDGRRVETSLEVTCAGLPGIHGGGRLLRTSNPAERALHAQIVRTYSVARADTAFSTDTAAATPTEESP